MEAQKRKQIGDKVRRKFDRKPNKISKPKELKADPQINPAIYQMALAIEVFRELGFKVHDATFIH